MIQLKPSRPAVGNTSLRSSMYSEFSKSVWLRLGRAGFMGQASKFINLVYVCARSSTNDQYPLKSSRLSVGFMILRRLASSEFLERTWCCLGNAGFLVKIYKFQKANFCSFGRETLNFSKSSNQVTYINLSKFRADPSDSS